MAWKRFRVGLRWLAGYPAIPNRDGADTFDLSAPFLAVPAPLSPPDGPRSPSTRGGDLKEGLLLPPCASSARSVHTVRLRRRTQRFRNHGLDDSSSCRVAADARPRPTRRPVRSSAPAPPASTACRAGLGKSLNARDNAKYFSYFYALLTAVFFFPTPFSGRLGSDERLGRLLCAIVSVHASPEPELQLQWLPEPPF